MASKRTKPPIGVPIRPTSGSTTEIRQAEQKIPRGGSGVGGQPGAQGPPGISAGDPNSIKVATAQIDYKDHLFRCNIPLFQVPPGWGFEVLDCRVECIAKTSGNEVSNSTSQKFRIVVDPDGSYPIPPVVAWTRLGGTDCPAPSNGSGYINFYHWNNSDLAEGDVVPGTGSFLPHGELTSVKCYPFRPFLANPSLSAAISVNLYAKFVDLGFTGTGQVYPAAQAIVRVEYWTKPMTHHDGGPEEVSWFRWDPPHTPSGACPDFPS